MGPKPQAEILFNLLFVAMKVLNADDIVSFKEFMSIRNFGVTLEMVPAKQGPGVPGTELDAETFLYRYRQKCWVPRGALGTKDLTPPTGRPNRPR